ncbi:TM0106 family RecB-like putative nuclease [Hyphomonas sp.]|uniref:TM0106 family RecB-like putative nuclease n=1 Tax=Hyphomonas sp. TaxID=87 RepID=UPI0025BAB7E3|nr:TM0106 family RecB-like putative nuclease [Hyphomonas sp.]
MRRIDQEILFSPSDLITFMESPFASAMDRKRLFDPTLSELMDPEDPLLMHLRKKGFDHEDAFVRSLQEEGKDLVAIEDGDPDQMHALTLDAMRSGQEVITQAYLRCDGFAGKADFLVRVDGASSLGEFHYEVWDTKLSRKLKPYFAIQLCCYAEMLEALQGRRPDHVAVVLGTGDIKRLRVVNYFAYYRSLKAAFLDFHADTDAPTPDPALSNSHGDWSELAARLLEERDHLSGVANLRRSQILALEAAGIETKSALAESELTDIPGMNADVLGRAKAQARLQISSRDKAKPDFEVLPHPVGLARGLALLPPASPSDVFFDIEGFPGLEGGLEYLWGNTYFEADGSRAFKDFWAHDKAEEKRAFIEFIDWVYERWLKDPSMHIYHYASYEVSAIRRLMGQHGVCEDKVDALLRNKVFVDLYTIVRHGLLIGEPKYSIKNVEHIYRGKRSTEVASGSDSIIVYEAWRENPDGMTWQESEVLRSIRDYNIDDCDSTQELTDWLRELQAKKDIAYIGGGEEDVIEPPQGVEDVARLRDELLTRAEQWPDKSEADVIELLAWSLEFHRREAKPVWWRYFDRQGWSEAELYEDMDCLAGVQRTGKPAFKPKRGNPVHEYRFDVDQPYKGSAKNFYVFDHDDLKLTVKEYDPETGVIAFGSKKDLPERMNLLPDEFVSPKPIPEAIQHVVEDIMASGMKSCAIVDFLKRSRPRISGNPEGPILKGERPLLDEVIDAVDNLENSYLCIQGPPGAGKTYTAKHIIADLLTKGLKVGIASNSHKAINNLLAGVADQVQADGIKARLVKAQRDDTDPIFERGDVAHIPSVKDLSVSNALCFGGTAWAFANAGVEDEFDYLFVDEAGQVSIANLIGMSAATKNIVLMGDQMQLAQPIQGSHPGQSGLSILDYLLQGKATIPADLGVFLPKTYRMHPDVCRVISEQVYDARLGSDASTSQHVVQTNGARVPKRSGICFVGVEHDGNSQASDEEIAEIAKIVDELLDTELWPDESGELRKVTLDDILFVAPYNYQVNKLKAALGPRARVGSVDKFQGQEAPIVILSMCASDASESPRGIEFLFSKNRLNVAISRAQALAIVVAHPGLANTSVSNLEQMEQVNFFCELLLAGM